MATKSVLGPSTALNKGEKSIEATYQKKSQHEHILLRPDSYSTYYIDYQAVWYIIYHVIIIYLSK